MAMSGLLGGFAFLPRALAHLLTFRTIRPESLILTRKHEPVRSPIDLGQGRKINGVGTTSVKESKGVVTSSNNQKDNNASNGDAQVNNSGSA